MHGATLGLVGFGRIARAVAQRAAGFDMEVIHTTRHDTGLPGFVPTLDELLERSDIVSLHVPLSESTRHLIGAAELARMKPTAVLVNTARGPVVDEDALADALEAGSLYAAGLDVFDGEPKVNPRLLSAPAQPCFLTSGVQQSRRGRGMARLACQGVCDVLAGRTPPNVVAPRAASPLSNDRSLRSRHTAVIERRGRGIRSDGHLSRLSVVEGGGGAHGPGIHRHCALDRDDRRPHGRPREPSSDVACGGRP